MLKLDDIQYSNKDTNLHTIITDFDFLEEFVQNEFVNRAEPFLEKSNLIDVDEVFGDLVVTYSLAKKHLVVVSEADMAPFTYFLKSKMQDAYNEMPELIVGRLFNDFNEQLTLFNTDYTFNRPSEDSLSDDDINRAVENHFITFEEATKTDITYVIKNSSEYKKFLNAVSQSKNEIISQSEFAKVKLSELTSDKSNTVSLTEASKDRLNAYLQYI